MEPGSSDRGIGLAYSVLVRGMARAVPIVAIALVTHLQAGQSTRDVAITLKARAMQPGELVVVTVTTATAAGQIRVRAFDRDAPAFRDDALTWRALVGIDLDTPPGTHPIAVEARAGEATVRAVRNLVVAAHRFPTRQLSVDDAYVNPPASAAERIAREARELDQIWTESAPARLWSGAFLRPVPQEANSAFGTRSIFNGQPRSPHSGADFLSPAGAPVHAPNAGRIVLARELYFSGNTVIIDHGLGLFSLMAHLSSTAVHEGDVVATGQLLGAVGATGRVTGPHLHWAVRLGGARIDPLSLLAALGK